MARVSHWRGRHVSGHEIQPLDTGWEAAATEADACPDPGDLGQLAWRPATVPGTAASVARSAGLPVGAVLDGQDWWFRTTFDATPAAAGEEVVLCIGGIATIAQVHLNQERVLESRSMFQSHGVDVGALLEGRNELAIRCRALTPRLAAPRKPRARWRTRLVSDGGLRWSRTMLLGRGPGLGPAAPAVGPWRPIWLERRRGLSVEAVALRTRLDGDTGVLDVAVELRPLAGAAPARVEVEIDGPSGRHAAPLHTEQVAGSVSATGELRVPAVRRWWPHTHGDPALHSVRILVNGEPAPTIIEAGRVGFRSLEPGRDADHRVARDGLDLHVNGERIFVRGAVWTPTDLIALSSSVEDLRAPLEAAREGGMNMVRVPATAAYEQDAFHDLCDELGLLVWQDFMFANLDYPFADEDFRALAEREASEVLAGLVGRPSIAVLCGNSEIEQQVAMLGLDPELGRGPFFTTTLREFTRAALPDAIYVPSTPTGGDLPFRTDRGIAHYYGVGAYRRPLDDARASHVRFAAECLAFANVPDDRSLAALSSGRTHEVVVHEPGWKAGVPRDVGTGWDFDDVRDHYLQRVYGVDPGELRRVDHARYLELSRAVTGEVMAEVFGEWRRAGSGCGGAIVLSLRDLAPGAGWGLIDSEGRPKVAYHHLRRALAPRAVWTTDEGLNGVSVHIANDRPEPFQARLRVALYSDLEHRVGEAHDDLHVGPHEVIDRDVETLIGHFVDATWAYRFGPPAQDVIVATLERDGDLGLDVISQAFRFPAGRPGHVEPASQLGLEAHARLEEDEGVAVTVRTRRLAYGVRIDLPGYVGADDAFSIEPGMARTVRFEPSSLGTISARAEIAALNLAGRVVVPIEDGRR